MKDNNIEERLRAVEDGVGEMQSMLEEFGERQKETVELVQGHFEGLADTIRNAEEKIRTATDDAVERLVDEPEYPTSLRNSVERIEEAVESIEDSVDRLERVDDTPDEGSRKKEQVIDLDEDAFYEKVKGFVVTEKKASTSLLQRRFKIGYGRAARLMDQLETGGVIEPSNGTNRPRKVVEQ